MKKIILGSVISVAVFGNLSMAEDFQQYISGKASVVILENKFSGTGTYQNKESLVNEIHHKKNHTVAGLRLAYGFAIPAGDSKIRTEIEYGYNGKAKLKGDVNYRIGNNIPEARLPYRSEIKSQFVMANVYYDFNTGSDWVPYIGAGLGYARVKADNRVEFAGESKTLSKSSNNFAWNVTAGVAYNVTDNLSIDASYRYTDLGKAKTSGDLNFAGQKYHHEVHTKSKVRTNEFNIGIRYIFPD
ncbi:outer membrane protein [Ignatzschineria sp. LJL83]